MPNTPPDVPNAARELFARHAETLADHAARIRNLESGVTDAKTSLDRLRDSVDSLKFWILGTLAAASGGLCLLLAQILSGKH